MLPLVPLQARFPEWRRSNHFSGSAFAGFFAASSPAAQLSTGTKLPSSDASAPGPGRVMLHAAELAQLEQHLQLALTLEKRLNQSAAGLSELHKALATREQQLTEREKQAADAEARLQAAVQRRQGAEADAEPSKPDDQGSSSAGAASERPLGCMSRCMHPVSMCVLHAEPPAQRNVSSERPCVKLPCRISSVRCRHCAPQLTGATRRRTTSSKCG